MNMDKENLGEEEQEWHSYLLQRVAWQVSLWLFRCVVFIFRQRDIPQA
jgi:hypothetical protein